MDNILENKNLSDVSSQHSEENKLSDHKIKSSNVTKLRATSFDIDSKDSETEHLDISSKGLEGSDRFQWRSRGDLYIIFFAYVVSPEDITALTNFSDRTYEVTLLHHAIVLVVLILPLLYMELFLGQFTQMNCLHFGKLAPIAHGLGVAMILNSVLHLVMAGVLAADSMIYTLLSISAPWLKCEEINEHQEFICIEAPTIDEQGSEFWSQSPDSRFSSYIYWRKEVLNANDSNPEALGSIQTTRAITMCLIWCIVFALVLTGIKRVKYVLKVCLWITILGFSVVMLLVMANTGAITNLTTVHVTRFKSIGNWQAWSYAMRRAVLGLSLTHGGYILCGSYMPSTYACHLDAIMIIIIYALYTITGYSLCNGVFGIVKHKYNINDKQIHLEDDNFIFAVIPHTIGMLVLPNIMLFIYFLTVTITGICNVVVQVLVTTETIIEIRKSVQAYNTYIIGGLCFCCCALAVPFVTQGGPHLQSLVRDISFMLIPLCILLMETVSVLWLYGFQRLSDDIHFLHSQQPAIFWKFVWTFLPAVCIADLFIFIGYLTKEHLIANTFPIVINLISIVVLSPIILGAIYKTFIYLKKRYLVGILRPEDTWGPPDSEIRKLRHVYNPRKETRLRRRSHACVHRCLKNNEYLKFAMLEERRCYHFYLKRGSIGSQVEDKDEDEDETEVEDNT